VTLLPPSILECCGYGDPKVQRMLRGRGLPSVLRMALCSVAGQAQVDSGACLVPGVGRTVD
jgi:hypothetical protein